MAVSLQFEKRDMQVAPNTLRKAGKIPAVFYGSKQKSTPIAVSTRDFEKVWKRAGKHTIVSLKSGNEEIQALLHAVDKHPVTGAPRHADFYVFEKGKKLRIKIPIEFVGVSPAVRDLGGVLLKVMRILEVEAEPKSLPHTIAVNISKLIDLKSQLLAKDVELPEGVTLITNPSEVVVAIAEAKEEEEEEKPVEPIDLSNIEISEKRGKEEMATEGGKPEIAAPAKEEKKERAK